VTAVAESLRLQLTPALRYLLRWADTTLIHAQRLAEWCGHGPVIEEDIALTNMALDCIGQTRGLLTRVGQLEGQGFDEDQLAFLRDERDYLNPTLAELPGGPNGGDFAVTVLRNLMLGTWLKLLWQRLQHSSDAELAGIAAKGLKEARYHQQHAADWIARLGGGTEESRRRVEKAIADLWHYSAELFANDGVDEAAHASGLGPRWGDLQEAWQAEMAAIFDEPALAMPRPVDFLSTGKTGVHSEHMGFILSELQVLQRAYPGGAW